MQWIIRLNLPSKDQTIRSLTLFIPKANGKSPNTYNTLCIIQYYTQKISARQAGIKQKIPTILSIHQHHLVLMYHTTPNVIQTQHYQKQCVPCKTKPLNRCWDMCILPSHYQSINTGTRHDLGCFCSSLSSLKIHFFLLQHSHHYTWHISIEL